jgi:hypothetical protein
MIETLRALGEWLTETAFSQAIQTTSWAIPAIQTVHILCVAGLFASAVILALRLFGLGLATEPVAQLSQRFVPVIWKLLLALIVTGLLLIVAEPGRVLTNPAFFLKMGLLLTAVLLTLWIARSAGRTATAINGLHKLGGLATVLLWAGMIFAGRFIAYVESY